MTDAGWRGRRTLITGAASGIGRATALLAAAQGAALVLTDRDGERLSAAVSEVRARGGTVLHSGVVDLVDVEAVMGFAAEAHAASGGSVDVVMNIAGISTWGPVDRLEHEHWRRTVDIDLMGPIHVIEAFLPAMVRARTGGHLVNVSSAAGLLGLPWHAPYSAAKFGLRGVSEVLRFDLRRRGIGVTLVCPGAVKTPLVGTVDIVGVDRENPRIRKMTARFEHRAVAPEEVARRILRAVDRNQYLVYTSRDIQAAFLLQRWCPPLYRLLFQSINDVFQWQVRKARAGT